MQEDNTSMAVRPEMSVMSLDEITTYIKARLSMMAEDAMEPPHNSAIPTKRKCLTPSKVRRSLKVLSRQH